MHSNIYDKKGMLVRLVYLGMAVIWYVLTLGCFRAKNAFIVLCYHGVLPGQRGRFAWHIQKISERTVQNICVTFDDAFVNLLDNALPVLEQYGVPAVIFAVSGNPGERPFWKMPQGHPESGEKTMTADQLNSVSRQPLIRIGSHTERHPDLAAISSQQAERELFNSRQTLEALLGHPIEDLALPHGSFNQTVLEMARETGYKRTYTLQPCLVSKTTLSEGVIGRFSMSPDVWKIEFWLTCAGAYAWLSGWRRVIGRIRCRS